MLTFLRIETARVSVFFVKLSYVLLLFALDIDKYTFLTLNTLFPVLVPDNKKQTVKVLWFKGLSS